MAYRPLFTYIQAFFDLHIGLFPRVYRPLFTHVLDSFDVSMCRTVRALEGQVKSSDPARGWRWGQECLPSSSWSSWPQVCLHPYTFALCFCKRALYLYKRAQWIHKRVPTKHFLILVAASMIAPLYICPIFLQKSPVFTQKSPMHPPKSAHQAFPDARGRKYVCFPIHLPYIS